VLSKQQREEIVTTAREIRRRRKAIGVTQSAIDRECGFSTRVTCYAESVTVDHRSLVSDDVRILKILDALRRLEEEPPKESLPFSKRAAGGVLKNKQQVARSDEPVTLSATLRHCPDQGLWITQAGCDGMRERNPVCQSLRNGRGCRGVEHRPQLEAKDVEVEYTPPSPAELEERSLRFGRVS
jgi:hypothetical protein